MKPVDFGKEFYDEDDGFFIRREMGATPRRTTTITLKRKRIESNDATKAAARTKLHADASVRERSNHRQRSLPIRSEKTRARTQRREEGNGEKSSSSRRETKGKEGERGPKRNTERDERRRLKATAFKNTTGEREALKKENDKKKRGEESENRAHIEAKTRRDGT